MKKFSIVIISKPGFENSHKAIMIIDAETKEEAEKKAIRRTCTSHPKFKHRNGAMFWNITTNEIEAQNG
jgi:hypothetical protein